MKSLSLFLLAGLLALGFKVGDPLPIGSAMPMQDTKVKNIDDKEHALKDLKKENGLLVMFSCNTCPYVIKNHDRIKAICTFAMKNNMGVVVLNSNEGRRDGDDSFEAMKKYYKEQNYNWPYAVDQNHTIADAFGANRTPECYLFNKDLKLVYHGAIDDSPADAAAVKRQHLQEAIVELAGGKEISVKQSRSVGCTIKRKS